MSESPKPEEHDPLNAITPEMASAVGYVTMYWSAVDMILMLLLTSFTDDKTSITSIFLAETTFSQKLNFVAATMHYSRNAEWVAEWDALEKRLDLIRTKRNDVVHGLWGAGKDLNHYVTRIKARRKLSVESGPVTIPEVVSLYEAISESFNLLAQFHDKLMAADVVSVLKNPVGPPLDHVPSLAKRAQDQAREQKRVRKVSNRARSVAAQTAKARSSGPNDPTET